eukprot:COSAG02_NODE_1729_length_11180_cov_3.283368_7_plen_413_part_00
MMLGEYQGCHEENWQGQPGACLEFLEGVCTSHRTGRPLCIETPNECPDDLPYCDPTGCSEGMCTCMRTPNPPLFSDVMNDHGSQDNGLHCSSSCIVGDCDECCGCDCGAEWTTSDTDTATAASLACNRNATTSCTGTQPDFLTFVYADTSVTPSLTPEYLQSVLVGRHTCAPLTSTYPGGLGPAKAATTADECEQWAIESGGSYGGLLPADIYGCYRPATYDLRQRAGVGSYMDNNPNAPWYFSNTGNGAPSTYSGGQCTSLCTVPAHCIDYLGSLDGGKDCCGCLTGSVDSTRCADGCELVPEECQVAVLCPSVCPDVPDFCAQGGFAFGCLAVDGQFHSAMEFDSEEWSGGLGLQYCGANRITCSAEGTAIIPAQYDCLCAEVGGKTCDLLPATVCPHWLHLLLYDAYKC